jgi:hypothetical protein
LIRLLTDAPTIPLDQVLAGERVARGHRGEEHPMADDPNQRRAERYPR